MKKPLLMRIARRKIAKHYSLMERLKIFVSMTSADENDGEVDFTEFEADSFLTEDFAVNHVLLESARQLIRSKPEDVQKIFYLMYDADMTIREIAKTLSMRESGVKNKLYRTLKELRNLLK